MDAQHNCPTHLRPCSQRKEENYFFRLSKYQQQLEVRSKQQQHGATTASMCQADVQDFRRITG